MKKLNRKTASSPLLRRPDPASYFHFLFKIFHIPPSRGGNQNLLPRFKRKGGVRLCQTQGKYYLVGSKIILMTLYSIFLQTINSLLPPLNHYFTEPVIFHTSSTSGMANKMNHIPTLSSTGKCLKLH